MGPALTVRRRLAGPLLILGVAAITTTVVSQAWNAIGGGPLGLHGLVALSLGVSGTIALTWALMALAFKSSRDGWDERADRTDDLNKP